MRAYLPLHLASVFVLASLTIPNVSPAPPLRPAGNGLARCCARDFRARPASHAAVSPVLVSPNRRWRAYVDVAADAASEKPGASHHARLFVAPSRSRFETVLDQSPRPPATGNGLQLVDWSPDSRFILVQLMEWVYQSDGWNSTLILYDTRTRARLRLALNDVFSAAMKKDCALDGTAAGFTRDNKIVFYAKPVDEEFAGASCVAAPSGWIVDPRSRAVAPLPSDYMYEYWGEIEGAGTRPGPRKNTR